MTIVFHLAGLLFIVGGIGACAVSKTSVHDIGGLVSLLIGITSIGIGLVFDRLTAIGRMLIEIRDRQPPTAK